MHVTAVRPIYSVLNIAAYFLEAAREQHRAGVVVELHPYRRTRLDLVKLAYIAHGWTLALCDRPLIHEPFVAYEHGINHPSLMILLAAYGDKPIKELKQFRIPIDDETRSILDRVECEYGQLSTVELSSLTGSRNPVWRDCNQSHDLSQYSLHGWKGISLKNAAIKAHYKQFLPH